MPYRKVRLVDGEFYHIFNRGVASQPTFLDKKDYQRMLEVIRFYQHSDLPVKYSHFLTLAREIKDSLVKRLSEDRDFLVEMVSFSLMPNHFHFLLKQRKEDGIRKFIGNIINSYTKYFNTKRGRFGPIFGGRFKAVRVETDEQLLHLSRYIHLQPYTSYIIKTFEELETYPYSSFPEYLGRTTENTCSKEIVLDNFKTRERYKQFVFDSADYQRRLERIKHLLME